MRILLTGASGFLGKIIQNTLSDHEIITLGRNNATFICDLASGQPDLPSVDLVIHSAGKAHSVPITAQEIKEFYEVNVKGTENLIRALDRCTPLPRAFVYISSVAVYGLETGTGITEEFPLMAKDPYGRSKIEAENIIQEWCKHNKIVCTILRLPLLAGPNPQGNLKNMIQGINKGYYLNIAGGEARKSVVLAEDVASIIPLVSGIGGIYNLTDGYHPTFHELSLHIAAELGKKAPFNIPLWLATSIANIGQIAGSKIPLNKSKLTKMISDLTFEDRKAVRTFNWHPTPVLRGLKIK